MVTQYQGTVDVAPRPFVGPIEGLETTAPSFGGRYALRFPCTDPGCLDQDEAYFILSEEGDEQRIRFHDYGEIYRRPGLYEQVFYERLKCQSPLTMVNWLEEAAALEGDSMTGLRVLDFGAGNGIVAQELASRGSARIVGVDILAEAREAAFRDRPGLYDDYLIDDFCSPHPDTLSILRRWQFNCLISVAALGFGDVPLAAFIEAARLVEPGGWICFNMRDRFLSADDSSGYAGFMQSVFCSHDYEVLRMQKYRHRFSIDGTPLHYYGVLMRKQPIL